MKLTLQIKLLPGREVEEFIGCDFGQVDVCTHSDGTSHNYEQLKKIRKRCSSVSACIQSKGTQSSRRLLKRLCGRERWHVSIYNHRISKQIVAKARAANKGIPIEDLSGIKKTARHKSKTLKRALNRWSFYQLRQYLSYKAKQQGIKFFAVPAAYTSQMCADCLHMGERKRKRFSCTNCGNVIDADHNAARNIATCGKVVNWPEKSYALSCARHTRDLKLIGPKANS